MKHTTFGHISTVVADSGTSLNLVALSDFAQ